MPRLQGVSMQGASSPLTDWINSDVKTANTVSIILIIFAAWAGIEAISNVAGIAIPPETGMATNVDPDDTQRVNNGIIVGLGSIALSVGIMLQLLIPRNLTEQKEMVGEETIVEEEKEEFDEELVKLTKWLSARGTTTVQFFEWADVDNSGTIDMNEFADAMRTAEIANLPPWEVGDLVKVMDINNDGKINLPELDMMVLKIRNSLGIEFIPYVEEETAEEVTEEAPEDETEEVVEEVTEDVVEAAAEEEPEATVEEVVEETPEPVVEEVVEETPEPAVEEVVEEAPEPVVDEVVAVEPEATVEEVVEEAPEPVVEEVVEEVSEEEKAATLQAAQDLLNNTLGVDDEADEDSEEESDEDDSEEPIDQAAALSAAQDVLTNSLGLESEEEDSETEDEEEVVDEVEEEAAEEAQEEIEEPVEEKEPPKKKKKF